MQGAASFGRWVKQCRMTLDLTQEMLAKRVGCAAQTIRKIESGECRPSTAMAERLAAVLELPPDERLSFLKAARTTGIRIIPDASGLSPQPPVVSASSLPSFHTHFVGRTAEQAEIQRLLANPDRHLITLVGPGGIGKTRLAVEAGKMCPEFADRVVFVALAPISTATLLVPAIANAIGCTFSGPEPLADQLLHYLQARELLLILDNMEHVLGLPPGSADASAGGGAGTASLTSPHACKGPQHAVTWCGERTAHDQWI